MSASHESAVAELRRERRRALAAFDAVMLETSNGVLGAMLIALDKYPEQALRGHWEALPWCPDTETCACSCPLCFLALGHAPEQPDEAREAQRITDERLAPRGLRAAHFCGAWNARLIPPQALLCRVNTLLTARILKGRSL